MKKIKKTLENIARTHFKLSNEKLKDKMDERAHILINSHTGTINERMRLYKYYKREKFLLKYIPNYYGRQK